MAALRTCLCERSIVMYKNSQSRPSHGRPSNGRNQGRPQNRRSSQRQKTVDVSRLINTAPVTETVEVYQSKHVFNDFAISAQLKQNIADRNYTAPSPIQDQAIPHILEGKDVVGIANTGTGKTAAFLIPLLNKVQQNPNTNILIVAPTRELAVQIFDDCKLFSKGMNIGYTICIGGVSMYHQIQGLRKRPHVIIGTPGRLIDLSKQGHVRFNSFNTIVLDEVDRMLDMGFIQDVRYMIDQLPKERQSLFFSATLSPEIESVMKVFLKDPVTISVKTRETATSIHQDVIKLAGRNKIDVLHDLLIEKGFEKVLVFGRTKWGIEKLAKELRFRGFKVESLHGNKTQNQRQNSLDAFKADRAQVLLATDIASRGLDIPDVTHVINFDLPSTYEDYVHRIGRTGRADKKGIALSFID